MKIIPKDLFFIKLPSKDMLLYYLGKKTTGGELFHRISIVSIDTKPEFYIDVGVTHYL